MNVIGLTLVLTYVVLGYWATGETIYANKIIFHKFGELFLRRLLYGIMFGVILIPVAIIKTLLSR